MIVSLYKNNTFDVEQCYYIYKLINAQYKTDFRIHTTTEKGNINIMMVVNINTEYNDDIKQLLMLIKLKYGWEHEYIEQNIS